jgi:DNA phosphorothioation-dependent restriction protein DptH
MSLPNSTVEEVYRLARANRAPADIAVAVGIHRMQVVTLLQHEEMKREAPSADDEAASIAPADLWSEEARDVFPPRPNAGVSSPESLSQATLDASTSSELEPPLQPDGVYVGNDKYDVPVNWMPKDARRVQNPHLMIMGESGSGKTYAAQCLVAELAHAGIPSIIFDYGQSFESDKLEHPFLDLCKPKEHLIGEEGLSLNPLTIERDPKGPNGVATRLADVFDAAFGLGMIQKKVLIDAIIRAYADAGITPDNPVTWVKTAPSMLKLRDAIDALSADRQHYPNYKNAAGLSARLTTFFMLASFREDGGWSWANLIGDPETKVHILQLRGLEGKTQRVLIEVLLWHMFYHLKSLGQGPLRLFCVLDEAHHLSFRDTSPVTYLLREARKFGLGIIFASQQPEDFSPVAYSNSASKLIFQTADPSLKVSRYLASKLLNYNRPEELRDLISLLEQGEAFFISQNKGHEIHVATFAARATFWSTA